MNTFVVAVFVVVLRWRPRNPGTLAAGFTVSSCAVETTCCLSVPGAGLGAGLGCLLAGRWDASVAAACLCFDGFTCVGAAGCCCCMGLGRAGSCPSSVGLVCVGQWRGGLEGDWSAGSDCSSDDSWGATLSGCVAGCVVDMPSTPPPCDDTLISTGRCCGLAHCSCICCCRCCSNCNCCCFSCCCGSSCGLMTGCCLCCGSSCGSTAGCCCCCCCCICWSAIMWFMAVIWRRRGSRESMGLPAPASASCAAAVGQSAVAVASRCWPSCQQVGSPVGQHWPQPDTQGRWRVALAGVTVLPWLGVWAGRWPCWRGGYPCSHPVRLRPSLLVSSPSIPSLSLIFSQVAANEM